MDTQADQVFLEHVVKAIVDNPDSVTIERRVDDMGVLLTLRVHPEDMGQVVGRQGATAKAIRSLLRIVGIKHNARVNLKIEEPEGSTRSQAPREEAPTYPIREENPPSDPVDTIADELRL
ncbi:MAG: RNA-binding protein [Candidatus Harrisonbacteria bacterium CG10_big_fil_rev_8_21_14_0_10_38_8]|uniref:RNA-binding protein KhpA n=1 Tax=Candidatus Harrisonbacteria bacterium CG10_big_fil_rev_8_21_14_0_10_38_8 TaxID=1974582 RepID=A0A2M6WKU3_9BACT|nr:MAG: RNA-binding protein [Candidatus Harrisonbacteria bacterium CG10_big_fil_rev_8_21_14_0_10_38_8]